MNRLLTYLAFLLFAIPAFAQWEYGGKEIGLYSTNTSALAVAHVGNGSIVVAWDRIRGGDYDIYAQYVDSAGNARWGDYGMVIYEDEGIRQDYPAVLPDGQGGVFVVWSDWRHTWEQGIALYGQRLDSLGNRLWNPEGVRLTADTMSHTFAQLYDDGHGGFVVVYESSYSLVDIGAQRVGPLGEVLWNSTGIFLTRAYHDQLFPKSCRASDSSFVTIWRDFRYAYDPDSSSYDSDIFMQKFELDGNILWEADGIPVVHRGADQGYLFEGHDIVPDDSGGVVVVWVDFRHVPGNGILYVDRFSPDGQSMWQVNGMKLGDEFINEGLACQAFSLGEMFMFRWEGTPGGFAVSLVDITGWVIWDEPVVLDPYYVNSAFKEPEGVFKCLVSYVDDTTSYGAGSKLSAGGNQYWPDYPFIGQDIRFWSEKIVTDGYGGMVAVWKGHQLRIKIARVYADGHVGGDSTTAVYENDRPLPYGIRLWQNYPNPFNSSTIVPYWLNSETDVTFQLFNILGQEVFFRGSVRQDSGLHKFNLNLNGYPSGIYFLRMTSAEGHAEQIRITLVK